MISSRRVESNERSPSSGASLAGELSPLLTLLMATDMPLLGALYHSIPLVRQIQMVHFSTLSAYWPWSYLQLCTFVPQTSIFRLFAAEVYKHATTSSLIPFDSSRPLDSNSILLDSIHLLAVELPSSLYFCSPGWYHQIVCSRGLKACQHFEFIPFNSSRPAESNGPLSGPGGPLAGELSLHLTLLTATECHYFKPYTVQFVLSTGF